MKEIRIHGRGGQGSVTAAELIAQAAFYGGQFAQAFPNFGVERRGAPVTAFARLDNNSPRRSQLMSRIILLSRCHPGSRRGCVFGSKKRNGGPH